MIKVSLCANKAGIFKGVLCMRILHAHIRTMHTKYLRKNLFFADYTPGAGYNPENMVCCNVLKQQQCHKHGAGFSKIETTRNNAVLIDNKDGQVHYAITSL